MKPELTQARTCQRCGKALPIEMRVDARYCPPRKGETRCGPQSKQRLVQQLELWERRSIEERAVLQQQMPRGALGYRISVVINDSLYIFPKVGSRSHYNAYGQRLKGCYFTLSEVARIPITALYKIEYIGSDEKIIPSGERFMTLSKTPMGRLRSTPNPTARRISAAILTGDHTTNSTRLYELARHLGISTVELFPILTTCGIQARHHARATVSRAECAMIAAAVHKARGSTPAQGFHGKNAGDGSQLPAPADGPLLEQSPMVVMNTPALLEDEFQSIGRKLDRVEKDLAQVTSASIQILDATGERPVMIEREVDRLTGISFADGPFRTHRSRDDQPN